MILVLALTAGTSISVFGATYADSHPFNSVGTAAYEDFETFSQHDGADYHSVNEIAAQVVQSETESPEAKTFFRNKILTYL